MLLVISQRQCSNDVLSASDCLYINCISTDSDNLILICHQLEISNNELLPISKISICNQYCERTFSKVTLNSICATGKVNKIS